MTIRQKLGLLAVATTSIIVVVLGVGFTTSRTLMRSNTEIFEGAARGVALVSEVRGLIADIRLQESLSSSYGSLGQAERIGEVETEVGKLKTTLADALRKLPEQAVSKSLAKDVAEYLIQADVTIRKSREFAIEEATENITVRSRVPFESARATVAKMILEMDASAAAINSKAKRYAALATSMSLFMLAASIGLGLMLVLLRRSIVTPLGEMVGFVGRVAEGDLSGAVKVGSRDELGVMGDALSRMTENISRLIGGAQATSENVATGSRQLSVNAEQLSQGADSQSRAIEEISVFITHMNEQAGSVSKSMENLSRNSEETSASIMEMIASIEQVAQNTGALSTSVATTSASVEQILTSNKSVAQNTDSLNSLIGQTTSAITQIDASIKEVQSLAQDARQLSEEAKESAANSGAVAVQQTIGEMNEIRKAVLNLSKTVGKLTESVENIDEILVVIDDVAEQTNLLALNAAIIAAQAGDHGRGFAVVASEIRDLAERTSSSTKEISKVIKGIQQETGKVEALVQEGVNRVDAGVGAVDSTNDALKKIIASTERAAAISVRIASATSEQAQGSREVARSIHEVSERSTGIANSSAEQARGSETVMRSVEKMRDMAEQVRRATVEQTTGARLIAKASESATHLAQQVTRESQEGRQLSERAVREVATIQTAARGVFDVASRMRGIIDTFSTLAEELGKNLSQFRR